MHNETRKFVNSLNKMKSLLIYSCILLSFSSCSITKCRYSRGFNIELNMFGKKQNEISKPKMTRRIINSTTKTDSIKIESIESKETGISKENKQIGKRIVTEEIQAEKRNKKSKEKKILSNINLVKLNPNLANHHQQFKAITTTKNAKTNSQKQVLKQKFWDTKFGLLLIDVGLFLLELFVGILFLLLGLWVATLPVGIQVLILIGIIIAIIVVINLFVDAAFDFLFNNK